MKRTSGLTILELVISAFILLVLLGVVALGIASSGRAVGTIISESELIEDTRVAGQMISDGVARAVYIYAPGVSLSLSANEAWKVSNPNTGNNTWKTANDPILAYIEAPRNSSLGCSDSLTVVASASVEGCLFFVAYYAIKRSVLTSNRAYLLNKGNENKWVLFEYRKRLDLTELTASTPPPTNITATGSTSEILSDYIDPTAGFVLTEQQCRNKASDVGQATCGGISTAFYLDTIFSAELDLKARYSAATKDNLTPDMTFSVAPRNLY